MDLQIAKKTQSLTTAEEMRNQTKLVMQPYANWEEYLTPAPLSIAILGELVFISSNTDFSINKNRPDGGYKFIRYPESFRACLMQVCNSGWWAFNEAHKNMDQIRLHTMAVPDYMKTAVKILFQGSDEVVEAHLPDQLENICVVADECLELANSTEKQFTDVINIIQELLEACVNAEHFYGEELDAIKIKLDEAKLRKQSSEEAAKRSEKAIKDMEKQLNEAHESYGKAMASLPSGWEMIGMDLVEGITEGFTTLINGIASIGSEICSLNFLKKKSKSGKPEAEGCFDEINIYSKSAEILKCTEKIQEFVIENTINWKDLYDQKHKTTKTIFQQNQFNRIKESLKKCQNCTAKEEAQNICTKGIEICEELAKYTPEGEWEEAKTNEMIKLIRNLNESARSFDSKSKSVTNSPALTPTPPMMYKEESKSGKVKASQRASDNARFRIEQSRTQLDKTREIYEKSVENMEKNQKELTDILITMRKCEFKEIDFNTTIKMLAKGMDAMGRVKEQWEKMVRFFQMVSNIVKTSLNRTLKDFVSTSEKTQKLSYNAKLFSKDMLYNQAFQATNIANLVNMISTTYTEVSTKHIMDRVSSLGKLMAMDKEKPEFQFEVDQLRNACDGAQKAILVLVLKNKKEFEEKSLARLEKIDKELLAILPAASPEEIKSIQAAVQSGFTEEEEEAYA
ncbi:myosin-2 heavy chain-like [Tachysurus fulvidraco]|uniref:myosin-2 heavy chain-like n=1 Tax=Tachysurus fulvidraco TaxID=1234273 RepID=UPI001FEF6D97|nr:myosin-2 heavy chain-like [Tachysurus fulvidraco]